MSFLSVLGGLADNLINQQGAHGPAVTAVINLVQQQGGVAAIVQKLQAGGLGQHLASWAGPGENQPVSGDQVHQALGSDLIGQVANELGVSHDEAANHVAQILPGLMSGLAQNGHLPGVEGAGGVEGAALSALGGLFGKH